MKNKSTKGDKKMNIDKIDIHIDSFGEIHSNISIDEINAFLDKNVTDKKLSNKRKKKGS